MQVATGLLSHLESNGLTDDINLAFVEEGRGSNASFIVSTLICNALKKNTNVLFVTLHNSLQHYQQICSKLGCNFGNPVYKSKIEHFNPLDNLVDSGNPKNGINLQHIADKTEEFFKKHEDPMYLIIDDLSYILMLTSYPECLRFIRYFVYRRQVYPNLKVILCSHDVSPEDEECITITNYLRTICFFNVKVTALGSGLSSEVTGHMEIMSRKGCLEKITKCSYLLNRKEFVLNPSVI